MTAFGSDDVRREALELGAYGYVEKSPTLGAELIALVKAALHKRQLASRGRLLAQDNEILREQLAARGRFESMVARSAAMHQVFQIVEKVAAARTTVLITGESGTGKELIARAIHARSPRAASGRSSRSTAARIPEALIESELFGHEQGRVHRRAAAPSRACSRGRTGGTLFLDEIGELPLSLQAKLLRVLQERRDPAGRRQRRTSRSTCALVAATNRDLEAEVARGQLPRGPLLPPERHPARASRRCASGARTCSSLAEHFLAPLRRGASGAPGCGSRAEASAALDEYPFPGNVRELENLIERAVALSSGGEVTVDALPAPLRATPAGLSTEGPLPAGFSLEAHLTGIERQLIDRALAETNGVKKDAAARLGLSFRQLRHRIQKLAGETAADDDDENGDEPT